MIQTPASVKSTAAADFLGRRGIRATTQTRSAIAGYLFALPAAVFLVGLLIYPLVFNVELSFQNLQAYNLLNGGAQWVGFANYRAIFADPEFGKAVVNTVLFTLVSVVCQIGIGLGLALFYTKHFRGNTAMRSLYLVAYAVPIVSIGTIFRWLLDGDYGVINWVLRSLGIIHHPQYWLADPHTALWAVTFINVWLGIPFAMIVLLAGLKGIPDEYYEAARMDGNGAIDCFRYITLPLLRPALLAVTILGTIFTFKAFDVIWITTGGGPAGASDTLSTVAYKWVFQQFLFGKGAAVLNVMFVVLFGLAVAYVAALRREEQLS